ncbi:hypothetical protein HDV57DRAFT_480737 [Trichoderma longibrachiatum]|uniref:Transmembrane protein n=1 Tax=Trichoderma longibrachiatum ATCC 18648 TaxID=983965 RepID=A0A2T4CI36_TRILO|nr:hypothetical protein M440DRAFT_1010390 [Trichoderma longibrachiatum ATCC 18648]
MKRPPPSLRNLDLAKLSSFDVPKSAIESTFSFRGNAIFPFFLFFFFYSFFFFSLSGIQKESRVNPANILTSRVPPPLSLSLTSSSPCSIPNVRFRGCLFANQNRASLLFYIHTFLRHTHRQKERTRPPGSKTRNDAGKSFAFLARGSGGPHRCCYCCCCADRLCRALMPQSS